MRGGSLGYDRRTAERRREIRMDEATTFPLDESDLPTHWVNLAPDLPGRRCRRCTPARCSRPGPTTSPPIFPLA